MRVVLGGVEETAWTDLTTLRLPERHLSVAQPPATVHGPATQEMSVARHPSGRRARSADGDSAATANLPMVRDLSVVPDLPSSGGRRTADETAQFASVGRRRAPETADVPAVGRRRAPETAESPSVGRRRAPEGAPAASPARRGLRSSPRGSADSASGRPPPRPSAPVAGRPADASRDGWTAPEGLDADLLTRPMRLSDHVPHSRRPRPGGSRNV